MPVGIGRGGGGNPGSCDKEENMLWWGLFVDLLFPSWKSLEFHEHWHLWLTVLVLSMLREFRSWMLPGNETDACGHNALHRLFLSTPVNVEQYLSHTALEPCHIFPLPSMKYKAGHTTHIINSTVCHCITTGASHASHLGCPWAYSSRLSLLYIW